MYLTGFGFVATEVKKINLEGTSKVYFKIVWNETRKGISTPHFLDFEAWDSGADYLFENLKKGDEIYVEAIPKQENWEKNGVKKERIYFRINQFRIIKS